MNRVITTVTALAITSIAAAANPVWTDVARNEHGYTLTLNYYNFVNGGWRGDAGFSISACPQVQCFHFSGSALLPIDPSSHVNEGSFSIPGKACDVHFQEMLRNEMDSGDWRVSLRSRDSDGKGCAFLPADLAGEYKQLSRGAGRQ